MTQQFRAGMVGASRIGPPVRLDAALTVPAQALLPEPSAQPRTFIDSLFPGLQGAIDGLQSFNPFTPPRSAAAPSPRGSFAEALHVGADGSRSYKLYVPACAGREASLPLVVMLHGCNQSPDDFAAGTRMNDWAERDGFLVCYPAQPSSANGQRCWNWFAEGDQRRGRGEPELIAGITREVMSRHRVDADRVYVGGLSAGGALAATMGQRYPDLFAAVGVHSGLACGAARDVGSALAAMRGSPDAPPAGFARVPTIVFHGDRDGTVDAVNADAVAVQALHGAAVVSVTEAGDVPTGHGYRRTRFLDAAGRALAERWIVRGAGHAWSGGSTAGSHTDPLGPDASGEMLRFFAEHVGAAGRRGADRAADPVAGG